MSMMVGLLLSEGGLSMYRSIDLHTHIYIDLLFRVYFIH
jgi:hypothetical protein